MKQRAVGIGQFVVTRRRVIGLAGLSVGAVAAGAVTPAAVSALAVTDYLHRDTDRRGEGRLYSGSVNHPGCDTAHSADCPGPGLLSAYWGGLYVHSVPAHRLRTGPFTGSCGARFPGSGAVDRLRWATTRSWAPEYRFAGRLCVNHIGPRPAAWTGLVFHPVHVDNCNNYYIRIWERDQPRLTFAREVDDAETLIAARPFANPTLHTWHEYRIDVLPGSRIRFHWNGALILDAVDPARAFNGGSVGMRLDHFDTILADTRVYMPSR